MRAANVSLVAFYGDKPVELKDLIAKLQEYLASHPLLKTKFIPYQMSQVHGTIIGCEGWSAHRGIISRWFKERRKEEKYLDLAALATCSSLLRDFPLTIRWGGYEAEQDYNFLSRGQTLYTRSFQLQSAADITIPVLIGWSWQDNGVTLALDRLRRSFQQFNLLHKYHDTNEAIDNDFYLRLGTINARLSAAEIKEISSQARNILSASSILIPLRIQDLAFVRYQDIQLTPRTTQVISLNDITTSQLEQLYA